MAFADPQTVTINAVANSLPRVGSGMGEGRFSKDDGNVVLTIRQRVTAKGRKQTVARFDLTKVGADPFNGSLNAKYGQSFSLVSDVPQVGFTAAEAKQLADGVLAWATASSGANITRLLGGES